MNNYIIRQNKKILAEVFIYNNINNNKEELVESILKEVPYIKSIGYAGYLSKDALKKFLSWGIIKEENNAKIKKIKEKESLKEIKKILNKFKDITKYEKKLYIFLFSTFESNIIKKLVGISGYCTWKNTIIIFIYPINGWNESLRETFGHELAHSLSPYYHKENTIGEWLIFEGIAEHFREHFDKSGKSDIVKSISKIKSMKILNSIKSKLYIKNEELHTELFYGTGRYPLWSGYSIGYYIVENYLKKQKKINWNKIVEINPKIILKNKIIYFSK